MKANSQSQLSKQWIVTALLELLETKPYSEITITEITKKAGVARLTFYRNFENKEQILTTRSENLFNEYLKEFENESTKTDIQQALQLAFDYWQRDSVALTLLIKNQLIYLTEEPFYRFMEKILAEIPNMSTLNMIQKTFIIGGITRTMLNWITNPNNISPKEVSKSILSIIDLEYF